MEENKNGMNTTQQNSGQEPGAGQGQEPKTFTQEEVNRIVQERLARVKAQAGPSEKELELQQRETAIYVKERVSEMGLPKELCDSLKGLDKGTVDKCIQIIAPFAQKASEPIHNAVMATGGGSGGDDAIRRAMGLKQR